MATKDHPKHHQLGVKHPSGLAPSILCMLAHFHGLLALPGCLKWTILPPPKAYVEKSFREPQFLYFTIKTKDTNRMNPCTSSLLTLFQEQTFYQTFNFCRDDDFFLLPLNFPLHLYNCGPAAVPFGEGFSSFGFRAISALPQIHHSKQRSTLKYSIEITLWLCFSQIT